MARAAWPLLPPGQASVVPRGFILRPSQRFFPGLCWALGLFTASAITPVTRHVLDPMSLHSCEYHRRVNS